SRRRGQVRAAELPRQREGIRALMLKAALVRVGDVIKGGVIVRRPVYESEVESRVTGLFEDVEVRILEQTPEDLIRERSSERVSRSPRQISNQSPIPVARFKHERRPARAPRFKVQ